jgi:hypothetical protein
VVQAEALTDGIVDKSDKAIYTKRADEKQYLQRQGAK